MGDEYDAAEDAWLSGEHLEPLQAQPSTHLRNPDKARQSLCGHTLLAPEPLTDELDAVTCAVCRRMRGNQESSAPECGHTAHDQAFNELIRAAVAVIGLSIAPADTPDLAVKQVGAVHRLEVAARQFALSVDTLPEDERPIGWKPLVPAERLETVLEQLRAEGRGLGEGLSPDAVRFGLSKAIAAVKLVAGGGTPESSTPGTGSRFVVCAGEG